MDLQPASDKAKKGAWIIFLSLKAPDVTSFLFVFVVTD